MPSAGRPWFGVTAFLPLYALLSDHEFSADTTFRYVSKSKFLSIGSVTTRSKANQYPAIPPASSIARRSEGELTITTFRLRLCWQVLLRELGFGFLYQ